MNELFLCKQCKLIAEVIRAGHLPLSCCGQEMIELKANTTDAANEKHVPIVVDRGNFIEVTVGSVEHPMTEEHYIVFIEVLTQDRVYRKTLMPNDKPMAVFPVNFSEVKEVREFCNLHMLWKA